MTELIKNEIGDNQISKKIGDFDWLEQKIKESYKEIYDTKGELQDLKKEVMNNLSGKTLKELLEKELTVSHVKNVLQRTAESSKGKSLTFNNMDAGAMFNMQLGLAKLGYNFEKGIDGMYGAADTGKRVKEFQKQWNTEHPEDALPMGNWTAYDTLIRVVAALEDPQWKGAHHAPEAQEGADIPVVSFDEAMKDRETMDAHHLRFTPQKWYEFVDPTDPLNLATKKQGKILPNTPMLTFDEVMKDADLDKHHLGIKPDKKYEWAHPSDLNDYATKLLPEGAEQAPEPVEETAQVASGKGKIKVSYDGWKEHEDEPIPADNEYGPEAPLFEKVTMQEAIKDKTSMEKNHLRFIPQEEYEWAGNYPDNLAVRKIGTIQDDVPMISHADVVRYLENGGYPVETQPEDGYDWADKNDPENYATMPARRSRETTEEYNA